MIYWHSDGSNVDWGWRIFVEGEVLQHGVGETLHWLMLLELTVG